MNFMWEFPKIRGTFLGVPIIRVKVLHHPLRDDFDECSCMVLLLLLLPLPRVVLFRVGLCTFAFWEPSASKFNQEASKICMSTNLGLAEGTMKIFSSVLGSKMHQTQKCWSESTQKHRQLRLNAHGRDHALGLINPCRPPCDSDGAYGRAG